MAYWLPSSYAAVRYMHQRIKDAEEDLADADSTLETRHAAETTLARMKEFQAAL